MPAEAAVQALPSTAAASVPAHRVAFAWCLLAMSDLALKGAGFQRFYRLMTRWPTVGRASQADRLNTALAASAAVDRARLYYFKRAWCLQTAAAAVCFIRLKGVDARLVVGVRKIPFYAHAWAEVDGQIVNNAHPSIQGHLSEITRC
jgi:hypothetical protein